MPQLEKENECDSTLPEGVELPVLLRRLHLSLIKPATLGLCCGGRSKSVPSLLVQRLVQAESSFQMSDLQGSQEFIMTRMVSYIQMQLSNGSKATTVSCMEQLQCWGRFLEFLLEYSNRGSRKDETIPSMVLQLLRAGSDLALSKTIDDPTIDNEDRWHQPVEDVPLPMALRIWLYTTLLRLNQYCHRGHPFLLSMIWKTVANLTTSFCIPATLVRQAQSALLQHLQDGLPPIVQSIVDASPSSQPPLLLWKIVGFLLARWAAMAQAASSADDAEETHPTTVALPTLVLIRGLFRWSAHSNKSSSNQLIPSLIDDSVLLVAAGRARMTALCSATLPPVPECRRRDAARILWESAWARGKAHLLTNYLEHQVGTTANVIAVKRGDFEDGLESLLTIVEELLVFVLPQIRRYPYHSLMRTARDQQDPLEEKVLDCLVHAIVWMEARMKEHQSNGTVEHWHRLLVYWLSRSERDVDGSEDMMATLLSRYLMASASPSAFQLLFAQLFWDARTTLPLRSQIATVFRHMVEREASSKPAAASIATELWSGTAARLDRLSSSETKKGTRRSLQIDSYQAEDWLVICSVLTVLPPCHDLPRPAAWTNCGKISRRQMRRVTLNAAVWHCGGTTTDFGRLLELLVSIWKNTRNDSNATPNDDDVLVWTMVVFQQVPCYFNALRSAEDPSSSKAHGVALVIQLLSHCTSSVSLEAISNLEPPFFSNAMCVRMILEAIQVLGTLGIPFSFSGVSTTDGVQSVAQCFHRLLSSKWWSLGSFTMTAFLQFASTLPITFKSMLPQCVPVHMQSLLQCRLQTVVDGDGSAGNLAALQQECLDAYVVESAAASVATPRRTGPVFPTQSYALPAGSYCLTLPTQEGRRALVIFPPGPDSLLDLRGMLGESPESEHHPVHQLRQDLVLSCGNAFQ